MSTTKPENGALRIWHIPQFPGSAFYVPVRSPEEGALLLDTLAEYDAFQFINEIKPDYSNAGGLEEYDADADDWCEWCGENGEEFSDLVDKPRAARIQTIQQWSDQS